MVPQFLEIPTPSPSELEYSSEITQPIKSNHSHTLGHSHFLRRPHALGQPLAFPDSPHSVYRMCISLNKPAFTLLWLALEFFPVQSQGPSLDMAHPRDSPKTWDMTILSLLNFPYNKNINLNDPGKLNLISRILNSGEPFPAVVRE